MHLNLTGKEWEKLFGSQIVWSISELIEYELKKAYLSVQ